MSAALSPGGNTGGFQLATVRTAACPDETFDQGQPSGADAFRTLAEQVADPCVITEYRPGACGTARTESFGGVMGPQPVEVVKTILRCLERRPEAVLCDPDPAGAPNRAYLADAQGQPLARVSGLTPDQVNDALLSLACGGWEPARNREVVRPMLAVATDRMPTAARQSRFL